MVQLDQEASQMDDQYNPRGGPFGRYDLSHTYKGAGRWTEFGSRGAVPKSSSNIIAYGDLASRWYNIRWRDEDGGPLALSKSVRVDFKGSAEYRRKVGIYDLSKPKVTYWNQGNSFRYQDKNADFVFHRSESAEAKKLRSAHNEGSLLGYAIAFAGVKKLAQGVGSAIAEGHESMNEGTTTLGQSTIPLSNLRWVAISCGDRDLGATDSIENRDWRWFAKSLINRDESEAQAIRHPDLRAAAVASARMDRDFAYSARDQDYVNLGLVGATGDKNFAWAIKDKNLQKVALAIAARDSSYGYQITSEE